jgi:hypothetical protein
LARGITQVLDQVFSPGSNRHLLLQKGDSLFRLV